MGQVGWSVLSLLCEPGNKLQFLECRNTMAYGSALDVGMLAIQVAARASECCSCFLAGCWVFSGMFCWMAGGKGVRSRLRTGLRTE